jgi:beta-fructofuranosidase
LLTTDDPIAAEIAPADIWECPNLVQIDGQWVLLVSLSRHVAGVDLPAGVRYLLGDLVAQGEGWTFKASSGGVLDEGPTFYAPQVLADPDRTLLWGWAWELGRSPEQIVEAGWAGVLTFPRELSVRNGVLRSQPAAELAGLRLEGLPWRPGVAFQATAFELIASGPVMVRLTGDEGDTLVSTADGTSTDPARILVDGSIVETFCGGVSNTTRAYPTGRSGWVVDGTDVTVYRLGHTVRAVTAAHVQRSHEEQVSS